MNTKFRKLISRMSIKEKKLDKIPYPIMISVSPLPPPVADERSKVSDDEESLPYPDLIRSNSFYTQLPTQNILTSVKFPCPTLLRKSRSMSMSSSEGFYEEVKPKSPKHGGPINGSEESNSGITPRSRLASISHSIDENNNLIVGGGGAESAARTSGPDYMNLQELEKERRRLVAAQRVRAKYAESWIDGQVEDDSIVGDNKEKTKLYWETRMRMASIEKLEEENQQKLNGLNKIRASSSSSSPVIQKINAEIEELHRREKELMNRSKLIAVGSPGSQHEDEDDVFSSNGSSVDEFEHSESPRLESGFYSNSGEDEAHILGSPELVKTVDPEAETVGNGAATPPQMPIERKSEKLVPLSVQVNGGPFLEILKGTQHSSDGLQRDSTPTPPIPSESDTAKVFKFQKETPIEKEIRLASERDEEYRLRRLSSMGEGPLSPMTPAKVTVIAEKQKSPEPVFGIKVKHVEVEDKRFGPSKARSSSVQYEMATERLRKEMLEAQRREAEMQTLHRTVSMSTIVMKDDGPDPEIISKTAVSVSQESAKASPAVEIILPHKERQLTPEIESMKAQTGEADKAEPETKVKVELHRTTSQPAAQLLRNPSFVKPGLKSFNSIQRYLLKSSVQLRIAKNFQLPPPPIDKVEEIPEPTKIENVEVEPEAPRRKLVPATHKIQNELREMKEREKELALVRTRSFKSTPNLLADLKETDVEFSSEVPVFAPRERKRSNLINQWEMLIQSGN